MGDEVEVEGATTLWESPGGWTRLVEQRYQDGDDGQQRTMHVVLERHDDWYGHQYWVRADGTLAQAQVLNWLMSERAKS